MSAFITLDGNKIKIVVGSEKYTTGITVSPTDDISRIQEKIRAAIKEAVAGPFDKEQLKDINVSRTARVLWARMAAKEKRTAPPAKTAVPRRTEPQSARATAPRPSAAEPIIDLLWVRTNMANPDDVYKNLEKIGKLEDETKDVLFAPVLTELYKGNSFKFYLSSEAWSTHDQGIATLIKLLYADQTEAMGPQQHNGALKGLKSYLERYGAATNSTFGKELAKVGDLDSNDGKILLATILWIRRMKNPSAKEWEMPKQEEKKSEPPRKYVAPPPNAVDPTGKVQPPPAAKEPQKRERLTEPISL